MPALCELVDETCLDPPDAERKMLRAPATGLFVNLLRTLGVVVGRAVEGQARERAMGKLLALANDGRSRTLAALIRAFEEIDRGR